MADEGVEVVRPQFTKVTSEPLLGAEGPVFTKAAFFMVAPEVEVDGKAAGEVLRVDVSTGNVERWCLPSVDGHGGIPAGCQCDKQGAIWIADMRLGLLKMSSTEKGSFEQVVRKDSDGKVMQGCNDLAFDSKGNLWITAPAGSIAPDPYLRSMEEPFGAVYCFTAGGEMKQIDQGYRFSNGIAVTRDDSTLIVAETPKKMLWAYDITGPGKVANKRAWGKLPGSHEGGPDGMDFDEQGRLIVANWGSSHLEVFAENGALLKRIYCPFSKPSNVHFQPGLSTVYVTEHETHGLWKFQWDCAGQAQFCDQ